MLACMFQGSIQKYLIERSRVRDRGGGWVPRSTAEVRFNNGVKRMVMYAECNLITLMSCEVGYVRAVWYGGSTIQLRCKNVSCIRSYYGTLVGHRFFIIDCTHFISWLYTAALRRGTTL